MIPPHSKDNTHFLLSLTKCSFSVFGQIFKEEKIFLGNFCLSWLQKASEHQITTDFLYHLKSGAQARSKSEIRGVGHSSKTGVWSAKIFVWCSSGSHLECIPHVGLWLFHTFVNKRRPVAQYGKNSTYIY